MLGRMGQDHFMRGENEAAYVAFDEALKFFPGNGMLRYFRASAEAEMGNIGNAMKELRRIVAQSTVDGHSMPEAIITLTNLQLKHGKDMSDFEEAADLLELMIDRGLASYITVGTPIATEELYYRLQIALEKCHRFEDALHRMSMLTQLQPQSSQAHFETGRLAIICQQYELVILTFHFFFLSFFSIFMFFF